MAIHKGAVNLGKDVYYFDSGWPLVLCDKQGNEQSTCAPQGIGVDMQ